MHRAVSLAAAVAIVYLSFLVSWGFNYRRARVETRVHFDAAQVTTARVIDVAMRATDNLNRLAARAHAREWPSLDALPETFGPALAETARALQLAWAPRAGRPKPTLFGSYFRWAGIAGMTNPFGLEVLTNPDALPFERHSIVAHEWAHLAGFATESDAGFVGWLMCLNGDDQARYSGWLGVWPWLTTAVPAAERAGIVRRLDARPREDLRAIAQRSARVVPAVSTAAWRGYDAYLRSQRVPEGVASYEGIVRLIAGYTTSPSRER
jgi:hypothetical protein